MQAGEAHLIATVPCLALVFGLFKTQVILFKTQVILFRGFYLDPLSWCQNNDDC